MRMWTKYLVLYKTKWDSRFISNCFFFPLTIISISRVKRDKQKSQVLTIHGDEETHLFLFIVSWRHKQPAAVHFTAIAILSLLFHAENKTRITKLDKWAHGRLNKRCDGGESDKFFPAVTPRVTDTYFKRRVNDLSHTQTETSRQCCCGWRTEWGKRERKKKKKSSVQLLHVQKQESMTFISHLFLLSSSTPHELLFNSEIQSRGCCHRLKDSFNMNTFVQRFR